MDFSIPDKTRAMLDRARAILDSDVIPVERISAEGGWAAAEKALGAVRTKVKAAGLWAPQMPPFSPVT
jgi:hypothetical protein